MTAESQFDHKRVNQFFFLKFLDESLPLTQGGATKSRPDIGDTGW